MRKTIKVVLRSGILLYRSIFYFLLGGMDMNNVYTSYKCKSCGKEFILLSDEVQQMALGRYLACPYCNSQRIYKEKTTDDLKECMRGRSYIRNKHGAIEQRR